MRGVRAFDGFDGKINPHFTGSRDETQATGGCRARSHQTFGSAEQPSRGLVVESERPLKAVHGPRCAPAEPAGGTEMTFEA